jgi:hypothetical protein
MRVTVALVPHPPVALVPHPPYMHTPGSSCSLNDRAAVCALFWFIFEYTCADAIMQDSKSCSVNHTHTHTHTRARARTHTHTRTQPRYECIVPGCDVMSSSRKDRRAHLIDTHHYPSSFRVAKFIGVRRQQRAKQKHPATPASINRDNHARAEVTAVGGAMAVDGGAAAAAEGDGEMELDDRQPAVVVKGVPTSFSFGRRGRGRGGFAPRGGRGRGTSCYRCGKMGHLKRDCPSAT